MKILAIILAVMGGGFLAYATLDFPAWGDPASPASTYLSPHFIENTIEETSVPNVVTSILADYRGYDTMFETCVIFAAGVACFLLLRVFGRGESDRASLYRHTPTGVVIEIREGGPDRLPADFFEPIDKDWVPDDLINKTVCRIMIPFIQLFALYVVAHGHHSPGGGFQGGVILGAATILYAVSHNLKSAQERMGFRAGPMSAVGVTVYAGVGAFCLLAGYNFLDYAGLAGVLRVDPVQARSLGILFVEIGVAMAVMATMVLIYQNVASAGGYEEGL